MDSIKSYPVGTALAKAREQKGLSQREVARKAGLSTGYLTLIEAGQRSPTLATLDKIASVLETRTSVIIAAAEDLRGAS